MTKNVTLADVIINEIRPALGEIADQYDLRAIAKQAFTYTIVLTENGDELLHAAHYEQSCSPDEFWTIVAANEITPEPVIDTTDYLERQDQILAAMQLVEDLGQDAHDLGLEDLSTLMHAAYSGIERFRHMRQAPSARVTQALQHAAHEMPSYELDGIRRCITASAWREAEELAREKAAGTVMMRRIRALESLADALEEQIEASK